MSCNVISSTKKTVLENFQPNHCGFDTAVAVVIEMCEVMLTSQVSFKFGNDDMG